MSTQCRIAMRLEGGTYRGVICYYDGYPSRIVPALKCVDTLEKVIHLVSLNIKSLDYDRDDNIIIEQLSIGDITFDDNRLGPNHYTFNSLENLVNSRSLMGYELGVAHTYIFENNEWVAHNPYINMVPQPIDGYIRYLQENCDEIDKDCEW